MSAEADLLPTPSGERIDVAALAGWLRGVLPAGFDGKLRLTPFRGGQSNPTYRLDTGVGAFVLRKKPAGTLLPSAHAIDREYRVLAALAGTPVPVPALRGYCADEALIGTAFYVMDCVDGRVLGERTVAAGDAAHAPQVYREMVQTLADLHGVDWRGRGLGDFGRAEHYVERQVARWTRQLDASLTQEWPAMRQLSEWLPARLPHSDDACIVHGDYRLGNVLVGPASRLTAVLDWELATIGHPLADLGYFCISYQLPAHFGGCADLDLRARGIPSQQEVWALYRERRPQTAHADLALYVVFAMFRLAAIGAGVYRRALDGNAADDGALRHWARYQFIGETAWQLAQRIEQGDQALPDRGNAGGRPGLLAVAAGASA